MDATYIVSRPYTSLAGLKLASKFQSGRRRALVRWSVAYATTVPALFVLSLAVAGLLACGCQYILLKTIEKEVPKLENQVIGFSDKVINSLNNASEQWAIGTNHIINDTGAKINQDVLGWVNTTTGAINDTLNTFVDGIMDVLNVTFGGTVLYEPIVDALNCLILLKIQGIEHGLTWVSDHAYIDFPLLPNDTFSLGTISKVSGSEQDILATGPNGGAADAITGAMFRVTNTLEKAVRQEAIISTCVLLIWIIIALIGIIRALFLMFKDGDDCVYQGSQPTSKAPAEEVVEKHEMDDMAQPTPPRVPTYEQATQDRDIDPIDNRGNLYHGQSYTLTPRPHPLLKVTATSPILSTGFSPRNEKFGNVHGQSINAAIQRPTHTRVSSYGEITSPKIDPFSDPRYVQTILKDPFADPTTLRPLS